MSACTPKCMDNNSDRNDLCINVLEYRWNVSRLFASRWALFSAEVVAAYMLLLALAELLLPADLLLLCPNIVAYNAVDKVGFGFRMRELRQCNNSVDRTVTGDESNR